MKKIIVLYHARCSDGAGGAWAAWKKFGSKAEYIPIEPREVPAVEWNDKEVYVIDNSFGKDAIKEIEAQAKRLVILDHHASSEADVRTAKEFVFDNGHSGAVLAWRFFHGKKPVPKLLLHIEDFDLWKFKLPGTFAVRSYLGWCGYELSVMIRVAREFQNAKDKKKIIQKGQTFLEYEKNVIEALVKNAEEVEFSGYRVLAVNSPIYNSSIGHDLWKAQKPFGIVWYEKRGMRFFSLRTEGKDFDVSAVAKKFGGGGHKAAAGFSLPVEKGFPWKVI